MDDKNVKTTNWLTKGTTDIRFKTQKTLALLSEFIQLEQVTRNMDDKEFAKFLKISKRKLLQWKSDEFYDFSVSELVYIFDKLDISFMSVVKELYTIRESDKNDKSTN